MANFFSLEKTDFYPNIPKVKNKLGRLSFIIYDQKASKE